MSAPEQISDPELDALLRHLPHSAEPAPDACLDDATLMAYRSGALEEARARVLEKHMVACQACRDLLAAYGEPVPERLRAWADERLPKKGSAARRRPLAAAISVVAMAAAAGLALLVIPQGEKLADYRIEGPKGGVARERGTEGESGIFVPDSRVKVILRPESASLASASQVLAFASGAGGRLSAARPDAISAHEGGVFRFEARAGDLCGESFGQCRVHFVLLPKGVSRTTDLAGLDLAAAKQGLPNGAWYTVELNYRESALDR